MKHTSGALTSLWNRIVLAKVHLTNTRTRKITQAMEERGWQFHYIPMKQPLLHPPSATGAVMDEVVIDPQGFKYSIRDEEYKAARDRIAAKIYNPPTPS